MAPIPQKQRAVQLVGPDELKINESKPVPEPGPRQILAKVEAVGLCFSDLKLLKQFSRHARKSPVTAGLDATTLSEMPNYVPGEYPAVPGHETVVRVVKTGREASHHRVGGRYLVQTDYRWLPTATSNAAFGYNFEGALQEYVLMDERVVLSPEGESMLIPVPEDMSASALALVEPWACVEKAYAEKQRRTLKPGGHLLVVGETPVDRTSLKTLGGDPATTTFARADRIGGLKDGAYDDIIYLGANPATAGCLFPKLAAGGLFNITQCGGRFGRPVVCQIGRVHYGGIRVVGTPGADPAKAMATIPATAEIRPNTKINIVGAAGPMGTMHVVRALTGGVAGVKVFAGDLSDERLAALRALAEPVAHKNKLTLRLYNPANSRPADAFDYIVLMAPVPALVVQSLADAARGAVINIFAGLPPDTTAALDLDTYIDKRLYLVGTSGSELDDMKRVLAKVVARQLDTNLSVAAVAGLDGAIDGIRAVEKNLMSGKILVYPGARGLPLTPLAGLDVPLDNGRWSRKSEEALLQQYTT